MSKWIGLAIIAIAIYFGISLVRNINQSSDTSNDNNLKNSPLAHWHKYNSPNQNFSVMFPALPHHANESKSENENLGMTNYDVFVSTKDDGTLFSLYLITFPKNEPKNLEKFLPDFLKQMLGTNPKNQIKRLDISTFQNMNAVDFIVENDGTTSYGKAFLQGNNLFILSSTSKNENLNKAEFDSFIDSFKMNPTK